MEGANGLHLAQGGDIYLFSQLNTLHIVKAEIIVFTVTVRVKKIRIDVSLVRYNKNFV